MKRFFLLSFVAVNLVACSKNDDPQPDPVNPDPVPTILSKLITIDTTKVAPNDTLYMSAFDYDAQGRITKQSH